MTPGKPTIRALACPALLALLALLALTATAHARDSVQDCATFGPHSVGCRGGMASRDDPARIEDDLRRDRQERRNHGADRQGTERKRLRSPGFDAW